MTQIVVLGGGYAGIATVLGLDGIEAEVTLVNQHSYHHLTTLLHQPVVGRRSYQELSVPIQKLFRRNTNFLRGAVDTIDTASKKIEIRSRGGPQTVPYDLLVISLGWEPQFFDIPGLAEHALTLRSLNSSRLAKDRIEESLIHFDENPEESWRTSIVVGGGGLSGVELAGELADARVALARAYDLEPEDIRIRLVEALPTILNGLDPWLGDKATKYLTKKNVEIWTGAHIASVDGRGLALSDGRRIEGGTVIWTGGVRGSSLLEKNGFAVNRQGRAEVDSFLQASGREDVFIIGDCASARDASGKLLPPTAQLAVQQGQWTARNISRKLRGQEIRPYRARVLGIIISLGRRYAVGVVAGHRISGWSAAFLKDVIAYRYLMGIGGLRLALRKWWEWGPYTAALRRG